MCIRDRVLGNDSDPDGDTLRVTSVQGQPIRPLGPGIETPNGGVLLERDGRTLTFLAKDGFVGEEKITYHVSDGKGGEDTANVTFNLKDAPNRDPVARDDSGMAERERGVIGKVSVEVLGNDSDPDGDTLRVTSVQGLSLIHI